MKATLSLAALGLASLALCNCQQQNEPVAPATEATAPIVVTPMKSEIPAARSNMAGKTITFDYANATAQNMDVSDEGTVTPASVSDFHAVPSIKFSNGNVKKYKVPSNVGFQKGGFHILSHSYSKKSATTAEIVEETNQDECCSYELTFTSANSGTAKYRCSFDTAENTISGINFTIK